MAHNMNFLQKSRGAMMEVITEFVADASITPEEAANQLADAVELQMQAGLDHPAPRRLPGARDPFNKVSG